MKSIKTIGLGIFIFLTQQIVAQQTENNNWSSSRPDGHAPITVMADHYHSKGGWMFSYRFMNMNMEGLLLGSEKITNNEAHDVGYMVTPLKMPMQMHMLGTMFAPSNKITLLTMASFISNDMDLQMRMMGMNSPFSTSSSGFGDIKLGMIYKFINKNQQSFHGNLTISLPTGSIGEMDETPMSAPNKILLPYPMQIGSGTLDTNLGITYLGQTESISWGSQLNTTLRFGTNSDEYAFGNQISFNNWFALKATNWISFSARLQSLFIDKIRGENPNLNSTMVTTADTKNSGGTNINAGLGFNLYANKGTLKDLRLGFEFAIPLYQKPNGIQLERKETITIGLQYAL
ncbi:transporter [Polaribacter sp. P097]|uniref:transporter n=1 Tax=Polaribacter sp. P097 TaxID=3117398 RepID=UPI002FE2E9FC